tara:strand:- start:1147 stop:1425 length:279 start_codon:yes stop_codon:yes gene_type:complete
VLQILLITRNLKEFKFKFESTICNIIVKLINLIMKNTKSLGLSVLLVLFFITNALHAKKIVDSRIKMLNGEYAKLSDFTVSGPLIINFWTTW